MELAGRTVVVAAEFGGHVHPVDLLDPAAVDRFIADVEAEHGPIDVLVNNAGIDAVDSAATADPEVIRQITRLNLEAPMVPTRHALPGMLQRRRGHLVFVSSLAGTGSYPTMSHYCSSKAGILNFAGSVRWEVRRHNVGVTILTPGPVATEMWARVADAQGSAAGVRQRFARLQMLVEVDPDDIAKRTVDAVIAGRRHVRHPARLSIAFWLDEAPRRLIELILTGVRYDPLEKS